jgi:hypothetical protein
MSRLLVAVCLVLAAVLASCGTDSYEAIDRLAESYVKLTLEIGLYDPDFVDAYYGPPEWKPAPPDSAREFPRDELCRRAEDLLARLDAVDSERLGDIERRRLRFLRAHIVSAKARIELVGGKVLSFDEESRALYDVVAPQCDVDSLEAVLGELERMIPGTGNLPERVEAYRAQFEIPKDRIDTVMAVAIAEARGRTLRYIELPEGESFDVAYVTEAPWGAYNWYKGDFHSLIEINTGLPLYIGSPLGLACHEGYPGHHVQNVLTEKHMLRDRGWIEFSVQPLYCPQATINEGGAGYGIDIAFTEEEQIAFARDVLFPLAGLDAERAGEYHRFRQLIKRLHMARPEAIRRYLDGDMTREETASWLQRYALYSPERAERYIRFGEQYRSYVVTYGVGEELVRSYIEREAASSGEPERRWDLLRDLYAVPNVPSDLE